jgi:hypothetical protein
MTKDEDLQKKEELDQLSHEIAQRRRVLVDEYKRTHTLPSRGVIITPELQALQAEEKRRYFEIINKYKAKNES